jgi:hypothetical protein
MDAFLLLMYVYNNGLLTVNIEFIWRGLETGWKTRTICSRIFVGKKNLVFYYAK